MRADSIDAFERAIEHAFASSSSVFRITTGAFDVRLCLDQWALEQDIVTAFPRVGPERSNAPDFEAAIIGGSDKLLSSFIPTDESKFGQFEGDRYYAVWLPAPDSVLYVYDTLRRRGLMWFSTDDAPAWLLSRPLLPLIHAFANHTDWCPVHASAVGLDGKFVMFLGPGGAGKSTAALACALAGWDYAGDDFVLINPKLRLVAPLFASGRLRLRGGELLASQLERFTIAISQETDDRRYELRLGEASSGWRVKGGPVDLMLIPRRRGNDQFQRTTAGPVEVFGSMIPYTRIYTPGLAAQLTRKLLSAAGMARSFFIDTGQDPMTIPAAVKSILGESR